MILFTQIFTVLAPPSPDAHWDLLPAGHGEAAQEE